MPRETSDLRSESDCHSSHNENSSSPPFPEIGSLTLQENDGKSISPRSDVILSRCGKWAKYVWDVKPVFVCRLRVLTSSSSASSGRGRCLILAGSWSPEADAMARLSSRLARPGSPRDSANSAACACTFQAWLIALVVSLLPVGLEHPSLEENGKNCRNAIPHKQQTPRRAQTRR